MFLYSFFLLALPALFAAASQSDVGEPHFLDSGAALSNDGAENRTIDPNLSAKIGHLPLAPVLSSPDGFVSRASQLASHRSLAGDALMADAEKIMLDLRLLVQAHEKGGIASSFFGTFTFLTRNKEKKSWKEVVEFLNSQENIIYKPYTISDCELIMNEILTFKLEFPSLYNGTAHINAVWVPIVKKYFLSYAIQLC